MANNVKYGTMELIRAQEVSEDGKEENVYKTRLVCLCGNKMSGTYSIRSEVPKSFECEKCGNITFDEKFLKNSKFIAPSFSIDFKNNRGFGVSRVNASIFIDYDSENGVKNIELLKTNMTRKVVFDVVDGTLICYRNGEVEYDFKKEGSEEDEYNSDILDKINSFIMRNVSIEHFIKQIGTENSSSFYEFTDVFFSKTNGRGNKKILHRLREMLLHKENLEYAQILANAGFKNINNIRDTSVYSFSRRNDKNHIREINKHGKNPSQILNVPKSIVRKLLLIKQNRTNTRTPYYSDGVVASLRNFWDFSNKHSGTYDMNIVNNILSTTEDSDGIKNIFDNLNTIYDLISQPEYKRNQKRAIEYLTQDLVMYQGITNINSAVTLLYDYSDMVKKMGGVPERYPKSLKRAHDVASLNYNKWKSSLTKEDFLIATKRYAELECIDNRKKYSFIVPETIEDLIREGNSLNHCIASYDNRVIDGTSKIVFMRESDNLDKPLVSIEIKRGKINQARGSSNRSVTDDEFKAILEWSKKNDIIY